MPGSRLLVALTIFFLSACGGAENRPDANVITLNSTFDADFDLISHHNEPVTDEDFAGKPMLIYFGFTTCPEVCPMALGKMQATLDHLGRDADKIQPLFITVDPERDDSERLRNHLAYDPRLLGLTGSLEKISEAQDALNVWSQKVMLEDSAMGYTMDHMQLFYITDKEGIAQLAIRDRDVDPEKLAKILRRYL